MKVIPHITQRSRDGEREHGDAVVRGVGGRGGLDGFEVHDLEEGGFVGLAQG